MGLAMRSPMARSPLFPALVALALTSPLLACGGSTSDAGSGGSSGGGTGGTGAVGGSATGGTAGLGGSTTGGAGGQTTGGSGGMPNECQVPSSTPAPYATTFRFVSKSGASFYLAEDCGLRYRVSSCADGYSATLSLSGDCTIDCNDTQGGCIACGACPFSAKLVTTGSPAETQWAGYTYTYDNSAGCSCHHQFTAPAGKYRVEVDVFASEQDALSGQPSHTASVSFDLKESGGVVEVPLDLLGT